MLPVMPDLFALKVPVFWAEGQPEIPLHGYTLSVGGMVARPLVLDLDELRTLATDVVDCRLTSVTRWSVRAAWRGVLAGRLVDMVRPAPEAVYAKLTSFGGAYTTTVGLSDLARPRAVFAVAANGVDLPVEYGGPVRAVFPHLWGFKSAKSLVSIEFRDTDEDGYWETRGYGGDAGITATKLFDLNARMTRGHQGGEVTW
jgi:DMSO/TMAO reductase YedYZ molybdopterin-dependent catalytic subunit